MSMDNGGNYTYAGLSWDNTNKGNIDNLPQH